MENKGLVSVIIPVYNVEEYLEECIESVLAQTYPYFEIILVNDGSNDKSGSICEEYSNSNSKVFTYHKVNGGASSARNFGVNKAKGEYLLFVDSDDWINENAIEQLVEVCKNKETDIVFFDAITINDETGEKSEKNYSHRYHYETQNGIDMMTSLIINKEFRVSPCLLFIKKDFYICAELYFEEGIVYEDMIFTFQAFIKARKVAYLPEYLYFRRYRDNSVMTSRISEKNFYSAEKVYYAVKNSATKNNLIDEEAVRLHLVRCSMNAINIYSKLSREEKQKYKESYRKIVSDIRKESSYHDMALKMRTYGFVPWFIYKILEKLNVAGRKG